RPWDRSFRPAVPPAPGRGGWSCVCEKLDPDYSFIDRGKPQDSGAADQIETLPGPFYITDRKVFRFCFSLPVEEPAVRSRAEWIRGRIHRENSGSPGVQ